jgi:hypothetical protein
MRTSVVLLLLAGMFLAFVCVSAPTPTAAAQKAKKKKKAPEPSGSLDPVGRPAKFAEGQDARYALWVENDVWHLRVTSKKGQRAIFEGRVEVQKGAVTLGIGGLERSSKPGDADYVNALPKKKGFAFRLVTFGAVDALTFKVSEDAPEVGFTLLTNGDDNPKRVFIGPTGQHPEKAIFVLPARPGKN